MKYSTYLILKTCMWLIVVVILGITKAGSDRFFIFAGLMFIASLITLEANLIKEKMDQK